MKKRNTRKTLSAIAAGSLAVALLIGGTFAWSDLTQKASNEFAADEKTKNYEAKLIEDFEDVKAKTWEPGQTINKDVYVKNTGEEKIFVRVSFDEMFNYMSKVMTDPVAHNPNTFAGITQPTIAEAQSMIEWIFGTNVKSMNDFTGAEAAWFYDEETGWFYWGEVLPANLQTTKLLDAVKMSALAVVEDHLDYQIDVNMQAFSADQLGVTGTDKAGNKGLTLVDTDAGITTSTKVLNFVDKVIKEERKIVTDADGNMYAGPNADGVYEMFPVGTPTPLVNGTGTPVVQKDPSKPITDLDNATSKLNPLSNVVSDGSIVSADTLGDTSDWLVVAKEGDNVLIVRKDHLTGNTAFGVDNKYVGSNVQTKINEFYTTLHAAGKVGTIAMDSTALTQMGAFPSTTTGFSKPTTLAGTKTADIAFALSFAEASNYISKYVYPDSNVWYSGKKYLDSSDAAIANWTALNDETAAHWWLRSVGLGSYASYMAYIDGLAAYHHVTDDIAVRPALWVKSSAVTPAP